MAWAGFLHFFVFGVLVVVHVGYKCHSSSSFICSSTSPTVLATDRHRGRARFGECLTFLPYFLGVAGEVVLAASGARTVTLSPSPWYSGSYSWTSSGRSTIGARSSSLYSRSSRCYLALRT